MTFNSSISKFYKSITSLASSPYLTAYLVGSLLGSLFSWPSKLFFPIAF